MKLQYSITCTFYLFVVMALISVTMTGVLDVGQTQVLMRTDLPPDIVLHFISTFEVLRQPLECSYTTLTRCHSSEELYDAYYEHCYSSVCEKRNYFCLNDFKGNTIHICGHTENCKKRSRNIVVFNATGSDYVDVYSVDCPVGYFQSNKGNCFTPCRKDESIVVVKGSSPQTRTLAHCNSQNNYCHVKGVIFFELGSDEDECLDSELDLHIQCKETEELLPNCSCVQTCLPHEEREWNGNFLCSSSSKSGDDKTRTALIPFTQRPTQRSSPQKSEEMINTAESNEENLSVKDGSKQVSGTYSNQSNQTILVVAMVLIAIFLAVIAVLVGLGIVKFIQKRDYRAVSVTDNGTDGQTTAVAIQINNNCEHANGHQNKQRTPSTGCDATSSESKNTNAPPTEPQMQNLKFPDEN